YCSPTRAGLLTGRYQTRFGHEFNPGGMNQGLPLTETTLADRFKAAGYATGLVGKWHLGGTDEQHPQKRGFDEFFGFLGGAHDYFQPTGVLRGTKPAGEQGYLTDAIGREAVAFIHRHKAAPFLLSVTSNAVHTPMQADDARLKKFAGIADQQRRTYAAMMFALDEAVGKVLAKLKDDKLDTDTLIFFFSDNGGPTMKGTTINRAINDPPPGAQRREPGGRHPGALFGPRPGGGGAG